MAAVAFAVDAAASVDGVAAAIVAGAVAIAVDAAATEVCAVDFLKAAVVAALAEVVAFQLPRLTELEELAEMVATAWLEHLEQGRPLEG